MELAIALAITFGLTLGTPLGVVVVYARRAALNYAREAL